MAALSVVDLLNQALRRIGYQTPIGFIYEGSRAARVAVEFYGQERDDLLSSNDWRFARQEVSLALLKTAPVGGYNYATPWSTTYPPLPWVYEYAYPANCLTIRSVRRVPVIVPNFDPVPNIFDTVNDPSLQTPAKVVVTNISNAVASFTAQVTDPAQWADSQFIETMIDRMALRFQENLNPEPNAVKARATEDQVGEAMGQDNRG